MNSVVVVDSKSFDNTKPALVAARYDNGYWAKLADGTFRNATKRSIPEASESMLSLKFAKAVTGPNAPWQSVLGHDLEIVPLADPAKVASGLTLPVRVLFRGQPLAGTMVVRGKGKTAMPDNDIPRFATDQNGVASIALMKTGQTLLVVEYRAASAADNGEEIYNATFWFVAR